MVSIKDNARAISSAERTSTGLWATHLAKAFCFDLFFYRRGQNPKDFAALVNIHRPSVKAQAPHYL